MEPLIRPPRPVDACTARLRTELLTEAFPIGARLPAERDLASHFQVSRSTLRSALDRLVGEGLLSVRQGRGYEVLDYRHSGGPDLVSAVVRLSDPVEQHQAVAELLELRRAFARVLLQKLFAAKGTANTRALSGVVEGFADQVALGAPSSELALVDVEIIRVMVSQSGSVILGLFLNSILEILSALPNLRDAIYRNPLTNLIAHRGAVQWITSGELKDLDLLLAALERHDDATLAYFSDQEP